jgi:hypothetical protein
VLTSTRFNAAEKENTSAVYSRKMLHHLMIGTWRPPGRIYTVVFDDEALTLSLLKRTEIPEDEPISWMTFDVRVIEIGRHVAHKVSMQRRISTALP